MTGSVTFTADPPIAKIVYTAADLKAATNTVTLYRISGGATTTVRSAINAFAAGGLAVEDTEVPVGVKVTYRAEQFDAAGKSIGIAAGDTITIPAQGKNIAYISDPLDATQTVKVTLADGAGASPTRTTPGTLYRVGMRTIALVGTPGLLEGLNMDFYTSTQADYDTIQGLVQQTGGLLLIRTAPPIRIPRLLYCWASNMHPLDFDLFGGDEGSAWTNKVDEISAPDGDLRANRVPWSAYMAAFPTWGDMNAAYMTWLDARRDPPEA